MASNTLLTISMITNEALAILENNLTFAKQVNRQYDDQFAKSGAKIGNTLNIRMPVKYAVTTGAALSVQDTVERSVPVTLTTQAHVDMEFSSVDLALSMDEFSDRVLKPAIAELANKIDYDGLSLVNKIPNAVGSPTALASDLKTYLAAGVKLDNESTPRDDMRAIVIGSASQAAIVDGLKGLFNDVTEISKQYKEGTMGRTAGFKWSMDQNVQMHTNGTGTADPVAINGASQTGSTLTVDGLSGTLKAGDTFTIAGVYAVNPMSKQSTGQLRQFVVLSDVGAAGTSLSISPAIVTTGVYKNVTVGPANDALLTFIGVASATYEIGVAFHRDAFVLVTADLPLPKGTDRAARVSDSQLGISLRVISDYVISTDQFVTRIDVLYGWAIIRPEFAVKIINNPALL
jgi:hypothetical protein